MDWSRIPSLSALRAFDALARCGSLSAAARELNVTHAAIAQHLRALESHFGESLANRDGQAMRLTETGYELAEALDEGFSRIDEGVSRIFDRTAQRPVKVTLTPTFAETWLMPRMGAFWKAHPDLELHLNPTAALTDMRRDGIDIGIRFGKGPWPGVEAEPLLESNFTVVAAPDYTDANTLEDLGDLNQYTWLYSPGSNEQVIWGRSLGLDLDAPNVQAMPSHGMVLSGVRAGLGLATESRMLVDSDIRTGQLKILHEAEAGGLGYHIITRPGVLVPGARVFRAWLRKMAQEQV